VGGVGTRQNVYNPRGFLQRVNDMYLDYRYFDENAAQTVVGRAVSCLSGRTAVYRRKLLLEISHDFMTETFLGVPCMSGDDKRLTTLILERGHLTYLQRTARVWSTFPGTVPIFFKQRLRWARNTWRSDLRALLWIKGCLARIRPHAYEFAVEVVDLPRFQSGTAVHLGPDIPLNRQAWPVPDYPQLTQGRHKPMAKQQMTSQRKQRATEQVRIADVEEDGAQ
jgi:Glycosyltransferase like family 2